MLLMALPTGVFAAQEFHQEVLFRELLPQMSYYLEYFRQIGPSASNLSPAESGQLNQLIEVLRDRSHSLNFSAPREEFTLKPGEPERVAKTTSVPGEPIDINSGMLSERSIELDIPMTIQLLIHELGHKLQDQKDQAVVDGLATKVSAFFKAYTQAVQIAPDWKMHILSLPINWFYFSQPQWGYETYRLRPNSAVFFENATTGFESATDDVIGTMSGAAGVLNATHAAGEVFTDHQTYLYAAEAKDGGAVSLIARQEKRLQPRDPRRMTYDQEVFRKSVRNDQTLVFRLRPDNKSFQIDVQPTVQQNMAESVPSQLEQLSPQEFRVVLPDIKGSQKPSLLVSTSQGPVWLAPEQSGDSPASFHLRIPQASPNEYLEIQSVKSDGGSARLLDQSYWFAIPTVSQPSERGAKFMQMQIDTKWRNVKLLPEGNTEDAKIIYQRWGDSPFRIQLQTFKKIRQIRFIWKMGRIHHQAQNLRQPWINDPFQRNYAARGYEGGEYAREYDTYEETFTAADVQQDDRTLTVPLKIWPRHDSWTEHRQYMTRMGSFNTFTSNVAVEHITGEDTGYRELVDVQITDENFETQSLFKGVRPAVFFFNRSGKNPCDEFLERHRYTDHLALAVD